MLSAKGVLYVTPGTDGSLALYTEEALAGLAAVWPKPSPNAQDVRAFSRLFYARAQAVELDSQGRVRIPPELAQLGRSEQRSGAGGSARSSGALGPQRWDAVRAERQNQYDEIAEAAFEQPSHN